MSDRETSKVPGRVLRIHGNSYEGIVQLKIPFS